MKQETLNEKKGYVDSWEIRDAKDVHPSHITAVYEEEDVKQFIKEILDEIDDMKENVLDLIEIYNKKEDLLSKMKILLETHKQIIKEKSGILK